MSSMTIPRIDPADLALLPRADLERFNDLLQEYHRRQVRQRCIGRGSFHPFVIEAWPELFPAKKFVDGLVVKLMCDAIEAVWWGDTQRMLINVPPRTLKSTLLNVLFPPWAWIQDAGHQFMTLSASENIAIRDASLSRVLITSPWYQRHWGNLFSLRKDENAKDRYANSKGGYRLAFPIGARLTGEGADTITIDDPHDSREVKSDLKRAGVISDYSEKIDSRLNDRQNGKIIAIMQRLHASDLSGYIIDNLKKVPFETIILPMCYDGVRYTSKLGLNDWRTKREELLFPERFTQKSVDQWKAILGVYGVAGQLQQSPSPREGGILPRSGFRIWTERKMPAVTGVLLSFDLSVKDQIDNDPSAFVALGLFEFVETDAEHPRFNQLRTGVMVLRAWEKHLRFGQMKTCVIEEQKRYTVEGEPPDEIMIEDKANGPSVMQELDAIGVRCFAYNPGKASKTERALYAQDIFDDGLVWVPGKPVLDADYRQDDALPDWAEALVAQAALFPNGAHDDMVDAIVQGVRRLRDRGDIVLTSDLPEPDDDGSDDDLPRTQTGELVSPYGAD